MTKGSGTNGVTSQVVFDKAKKALRYVDANDQYTYQEGDAYVMFFYMASSGQKLCVVEGTEYVYEAYTDYKPLDDLKQEVNSLQTEADNQKKQLTNLTAPAGSDGGRAGKERPSPCPGGSGVYGLQ